jgi:integrase
MIPAEPSLFAQTSATGILRGAVSAWPRDGGDDQLSQAAAYARQLIADDRAQSSRDKYAGCWAQFVRWLAEDPRTAIKAELPAEPAIVGLYIGSLRARKLSKSSILVHVAAIGYAHELVGLQSPWLTAHPSAAELKREIRGLRRQDDGDSKMRLAIERERATEILSLLHAATTITELRDRAIFCVAWLTALRRSNIAILRRRDVQIATDPIDGRRYLDVFVRRSKTDQLGRGRHIVVTELPGQHPLCAVRAVEALLAAGSFADDDPLFQSVTFQRRAADQRLTGRQIDPSDVARIVKRLLKRAGIDPTFYAAHSLRRGFATTMQNAGIPDAIAMEHGGWKSKDTYYRYNRVDKARHNAVRDLFTPPANES